MKTTQPAGPSHQSTQNMFLEISRLYLHCFGLFVFFSLSVFFYIQTFQQKTLPLGGKNIHIIHILKDRKRVCLASLKTIPKSVVGTKWEECAEIRLLFLCFKKGFLTGVHMEPLYKEFLKLHLKKQILFYSMFKTNHFCGAAGDNWMQIIYRSKIYRFEIWRVHKAIRPIYRNLSIQGRIGRNKTFKLI